MEDIVDDGILAPMEFTVSQYAVFAIAFWSSRLNPMRGEDLFGAKAVTPSRFTRNRAIHGAGPRSRIAAVTDG